MTNKRAKEQSTRRDKKRAQGYVLKQVWAVPDRWHEVQTLLDSHATEFEQQQKYAANPQEVKR